jgi:hypothetical protein
LVDELAEVGEAGRDPLVGLAALVAAVLLDLGGEALEHAVVVVVERQRREHPAEDAWVVEH